LAFFYALREITLNACCDSDWADNLDDRRNITSYGVFLDPNLIFWSSKKSWVVSHSSTKKWTQKHAHTTAELYWLRMLLQDLHITLSIAPHLWCDNISAIALTFNPVFHSCTKHIKIDYHLIKRRWLIMISKSSIFQRKTRLQIIWSFNCNLRGNLVF